MPELQAIRTAWSPGVSLRGDFVILFVEISPSVWLASYGRHFDAENFVRQVLL